MPIKKSAKKFMKSSARKNEDNQRVKQMIRKWTKTAKELSQEGKAKEATEALAKAIKTIDKAAQKNVIKKNAAARKKSRLIKACKPKAKK